MRTGSAPAGLGGRWPFVARREQAEFVEQARRAGDLSGVVIHGPAGVGKTRLAEECLAAATARQLAYNITAEVMMAGSADRAPETPPDSEESRL